MDNAYLSLFNIDCKSLYPFTNPDAIQEVTEANSGLVATMFFHSLPYVVHNFSYKSFSNSIILWA